MSDVPLLDEAASMLGTDDLAARAARWEGGDFAGARTYGHLVVDEAQELSEMDWRVLMRRCPGRSMTIAGDLTQSAGVRDWGAVLSPYVGDRFVCRRLTVNYRTHGSPAGTFAVIGVDGPLTPRASKGLEFDTVVVVDPEGMTPAERYVALNQGDSAAGSGHAVGVGGFGVGGTGGSVPGAGSGSGRLGGGGEGTGSGVGMGLGSGGCG